MARGVESKFPFLSFIARPDGEEWEFDDKAEFTRRLPWLAHHYGVNDDPDKKVSAWWPRFRNRGGERTRIWPFSRGADGTMQARIEPFLSDLFMTETPATGLLRQVGIRSPTWRATGSRM
ncbi:hypothetical protein ABT120_28790 [Nonomuraea angiospora]|uniref:hypothetical protein n=1 Tax=Nonomuraea angiospora TaxID=46172 RepID=UPI00332B605D